MKILVTGGLGFIGSHTCVSLLAKGHIVAVVDNLCNSKIAVLDRLRKITNRDIEFFYSDATNEEDIKKVFIKQKFDGVIHFAGLKAVGESVEKPLSYYYNNVVSTMVLMKICLKYSVKKFVFSSSATVYGENKVPFTEDMHLLPSLNPYGETKKISEKILEDTWKANRDMSITCLRYFNPVGAHESGLIGEDPNGIPNNLMPYITQVAKGKREKLSVFGNDYPTPDGTGVRDYIHVMDLAEAHVVALEKLNEGFHVYNVGTGKGVSVLGLIQAFEKVNKLKIPYQIVDRRPGDIAESYADASKIKNDLGWETKRDLKDMCRDAWNFERNN